MGKVNTQNLIHRSIDPLRGKKKVSRKANRGATVVCKRCCEKGHIAIHCKNEIRIPGISPELIAAFNDHLSLPGFVVSNRCFNCGEQGHIAIRCREPLTEKTKEIKARKEAERAAKNRK